MENGTKERRQPLALLGWAIALALAAPVHAETEMAEDETPWIAGVIVVTALAPTAPLTVETDPKQPRQPVPASDGADYLKTIPGFAVLRNGGTNGDPVLRGMFGSRLNLLTNDGSMVGACPARMDNALSYVSPETYDALTVIKGPQSVIWGPGGSAGTVRFERRTAPFAAGEGVRGDASALVGSWGRRDVLVDAAIGSPTVFARATANRAESDDYQDGDGNRVPSRWYKWNGDFTLGWTPDADTRLEATVGAGDGEARYAGRSMDGSQFRRESAGLRFEKGGFTGALQRIEANAFYNYADHVMDNYSLRTPDADGPMPMPVAADVDRRTTGGRVATHWEWQPLKLIVGADHQRNQHRGRSGMGIDTYSAEPWVPDARFSTTGVFAETTAPLDARQRLVAGARADRASTTDQRLVAGMMSMPNPTANERRRDTLASGFLRYERELETSPVALYAGVGSVERFPDYWELFSAEMATMGAVNPFRAVKPERTTQLDVGAQYVGIRINAWVSLYAGRVDDFILFRYSEGGMMGPMLQVENIDARTRGGELGVARLARLEAARHARLRLGRERHPSPRAAADAAAGGPAQRRLRPQRLVVRRLVAPRRRAGPRRSRRRQRGRPRPGPQRWIRRVLDQRRLPLRRVGAPDRWHRQPLRPRLHRTPEPCRRCGVWLPRRSRPYQRTGPHGLDQGQREVLSACPEPPGGRSRISVLR